ncbi:MAG: hypothetical protein J1E39_03430 [Eubacterium sp.]|nr:hypothetical protein [Eubacterium sp.]
MDIKTVSYQCPNCTAPLEYDNASGMFKCIFCDGAFSEQQIQTIFKNNEQMSLDADEPELTEEQRQMEEFTGSSALYNCPNCGAGVVCDTLTASTRCHFCHTPVILSGRVSGEFKPDLIIPFSTTKEQAESKFQEYLKGKFLLPRRFKEELKIMGISALYVPYWLKSGTLKAFAEAEGRKVHTWRTKNTVYTNTKIYKLQRIADLTFVRVPCDGSRRISDELMESIEPFDYSGIRKFSMSYLSGCAAEKYDVSPENAQIRIDERIKQAANEVLLKDMSGYTSLKLQNSDSEYKNQMCAYALLPVWFLNYNYKGVDYSFAMNGQTGTMFGRLPISRLKTFLYGSSVFLIALTILTLIGGLFSAA